MSKITNKSEWAAPSFAIPKKSDEIRVVTDFRGLNSQLKRKSYPMPLIHEITSNIEQFTYATCLDLSMVYYSFELDDKSKELCTTSFPWGLYQYNVLPMGVKPAADIF